MWPAKVPEGDVVNPLVTVGVFRDPWEARIAWGRLCAEDIPAYVVHEYHVWMQWPLSTALGGVKLQVPLDEAREATEILQALARGEYDGLLDDYEPVFHPGPCPRCSSADFKPVFSFSDWLGLVLCLYLIPIYPARRHWNFCRRCSHIWNRELPV